jgi:hypothetical protein
MNFNPTPDTIIPLIIASGFLILVAALAIMSLLTMYILNRYGRSQSLTLLITAGYGILFLGLLMRTIPTLTSIFLA